jgi:methylase of polypeptide subunit release factors
MDITRLLLSGARVAQDPGRVVRHLGVRFLGRDAIWTHEGIEVCYRPDLDGSGSWLVAPFAALLRKKSEELGARLPYRTAYEWCAGPAFLGFALLGAGICDELYLADINPKAIDCVNRTIKRNGLEGRVRTYVGDGVDALPPDARFDLVVANPPNYFHLNPRHPLYQTHKDDLRPNDPGWRLHRAFYSKIARHMTDDCRIFVSEVSAFQREVRFPGNAEPYDIRPRPAVDDFREMIETAGLELLGTWEYTSDPDHIVTAELMVSQRKI